MKNNQSRISQVYKPYREKEQNDRDTRVRTIIRHRLNYFEMLDTRMKRENH